MSELTYSDLPDEDKLLMDDLFKYKTSKQEERKNIRDIIAQLKKHEMSCTTEIMNLSTRAISEKFDLSPISAKALKKVERKNIEKKMLEEKKSGVQGLSFNQQNNIVNLSEKSRLKDKSSKLNCNSCIPFLGVIS